MKICNPDCNLNQLLTYFFSPYYHLLCLQVLITESNAFKLGPKVFRLLYEHFLYHDFSVKNFIRALKVFKNFFFISLLLNYSFNCLIRYFCLLHLAAIRLNLNNLSFLFRFFCQINTQNILLRWRVKRRKRNYGITIL